jgi:hypothetical protein
LKRQPTTVILEAVDLLGRQRSKLLEETQGISLTPTLRAAPVEKQNRHPGKGRPGHWLEFPNNRLFYVSAFYCETAGHSITLSRQVANRHRSVRKRLPELGIELLGQPQSTSTTSGSLSAKQNTLPWFWSAAGCFEFLQSLTSKATTTTNYTRWFPRS